MAERLEPPDALRHAWESSSVALQAAQLPPPGPCHAEVLERLMLVAAQCTTAAGPACVRNLTPKGGAEGARLKHQLTAQEWAAVCAPVLAAWGPPLALPEQERHSAPSEASSSAAHLADLRTRQAVQAAVARVNTPEGKAAAAKTLNAARKALLARCVHFLQEDGFDG